MTWKFVEIWSSTYQRNIDVKSTWIRRGAPVGLLHIIVYLLSKACISSIILETFAKFGRYLLCKAYLLLLIKILIIKILGTYLSYDNFF